MRVALQLLTLLVASGAPLAAAAQHSHQDPHAGHAQPAARQDHAQHAEPAGHPATSAPEQPLAHLEASRLASGTAWQPAETPHAALHADVSGWQLMAHALLFAGYDWQGGDRGESAPAAIGWLMGMAERKLDGGAFAARVMLSPEPFTVLDGGYPLLLQTGETYQDQPLHDRQHPHDLFMEAALMHTQELAPSLAVQLYAALAGEPALGPPGFPHRQSASADPLAPLGHHWQDSTHISFEVLTAAVVTRLAKLEGSWFNGREPDETRYDLELRRPDSFAGRLSVAPSARWVAQVSYGYLPSPELLAPDDELHRLTASATYQRAAVDGGAWATTLAFGLNRSHGESTSASLVESVWDLDRHHVVFGRAEVAQKSGHDLVLAAPLDEDEFLLGSLALGYLYRFAPLAQLQPGLGIRAALNLVPASLEPIYGSRLPIGGMVYLRLAIAAMDRAGH